ncbi:Uncharacterised protein [Serratia proteamaculans]|nr:Uncharacterised protein [Serratia proteamaculans]
MANFSREQVEAQIRGQLVRDGFPADVARSAAVQGADHYLGHTNVSIISSLTAAKAYAKTLKRVKDKPDRPHVSGHRMGRR